MPALGLCVLPTFRRVSCPRIVNAFGAAGFPGGGTPSGSHESPNRDHRGRYTAEQNQANDGSGCLEPWQQTRRDTPNQPRDDGIAVVRMTSSRATKCREYMICPLPRASDLSRRAEDYEGTMLFVSHDRAFLRALSNRVLELGGESGVEREPHLYPGSYIEYVAHRP